MSLTPEKRAGLHRRLKRLVAAQKAADDAVFVAIFEATQDGASQRDVAYMIGHRPTSKNGIAAKAAKGGAILEGRKKA